MQTEDRPGLVVHCDAGHLFAYVDLRRAAIASVREAVTAGAGRGVLAPTRRRSGPGVIRGRVIDLDAGRDGPVMVGSPVAARREAAEVLDRVRGLFAREPVG